MNDRIARAALTRLFEPGDRVGRALVGRLGAYAALRFATGAQPVHATPKATVEELSEALRRWASRVPEVEAEEDLTTIERLGGGFLIPGMSTGRKAWTICPMPRTGFGTGAISTTASRHRPGAWP